VPAKRQFRRAVLKVEMMSRRIFPPALAINFWAVVQFKCFDEFESNGSAMFVLTY
jgi:hypothetical protein